MGPPGTTYSSLVAIDEGALERALKDGWFASLPEAVESFLKPASTRILAAVDEDQTYADEAPPTREEMLAKAAELGMNVDKRWSDKTLAAKILEALK
jgi:hypothetical protein